MDRVFKFLILGLIVPMVVTIIGIAKLSPALIVLGIILSALVVLCFFYLNLLFRRKKKTNWRIEKISPLQLLEETDNKFYVIKKHINEETVCIFSFINKEDKLERKAEFGAKVKKKDREKPYVIVYKNIYEPSGFLDYLFYDNSIKECYEYRYDLYVDENEIRLD